MCLTLVSGKKPWRKRIFGLSYTCLDRTNAFQRSEEAWQANVETRVVIRNGNMNMSMPLDGHFLYPISNATTTMTWFSRTRIYPTACLHQTREQRAG